MADAKEPTMEPLSGDEVELWKALYTAALTGTASLRIHSPQSLAELAGEIADEGIKEIRRRREVAGGLDVFFIG